MICMFLLASCSQNNIIEQKPVEQKTDCPFGMINDSYPGSCGRYVDRNNDDICDLSQ